MTIIIRIANKTIVTVNVQCVDFSKSTLYIRVEAAVWHISCVWLLLRHHRKINDTEKMERIEKNILRPPLYFFTDVFPHHRHRFILSVSTVYMTYLDWVRFSEFFLPVFSSHNLASNHKNKERPELKHLQNNIKL